MGVQSDPPKSLYAAPGNDADENMQVRDQLPPKTDEHGYQINEQPMGTKRRVKVILMGAGASSLNFFKKAEEEMENLEMVCYEKNNDIGGTWLENRYPGCACDIPSVNYQFSWKIKLWSHFYSYSPEIWEYLKSIERENDFIAKYIKLRHRLEHVEWDDDAGLWRCKVRDLEKDEVFEDSAEFFINAGGVLNNWKWPDIPGLSDFKGKLMHSANYEEGYDLSNKRVAVIGSGSSGVQIVAAIQQKVEHLYHWVRSPIWITAGFAQTWAGKNGANFRYSEEQLKYLSNNPQKYLEYRKQIENELNQRFKFIIKGSPEARLAREYAATEMRTKLNHDARLTEKMIPKNFNPGCRRPTPAPGYLEALVAKNTTVFTDPIKTITPTGFIDQDGTPHTVDVIICATGFNTSWLPRFPFIAHGHDLRSVWGTENGVTSYLSVGIPNFPNTFSFCGPYGPLGHGSFIPLIEQWTRYIFHAITKTQIENIKSLTPKLTPSLHFRQHADLFLKRTA
ncbi:cyclohexanone monooxygenase [Pyrenophora tritici-repentis]|uniref:Cyclohexanone monooxygenase n=1 Tax=Pyrenophora tritici-repentis TaxID=45151 RepID=A0A2W1GZ77_9PLEO|nr:cyclohexanone monooxygenase [Pyrenophora tritici-repentis]KAF7452779.1 cyclohexanone monooxygenase [Pyrenophora tritici-repentis]KAF7575804.1 TrkA, flavoprotein involved in K+ transport [Pyrenophora tritici-repentis]KAG9377776.1 cyclohexanone monooxygenase [Pyrenophora tritici-repentis]KAI1519673.1 cyclohexanone monooxygenase [Pyrenophora tritici-repentis]